MKCPRCGNTVEVTMWNKKFCSYRCQKEFVNIINRKEKLYLLSESDMAIREKYMKENKK